jgi:hypothetical protein
MVIRIEAALDKLKEQLSSGRFEIETTTNKMVTLANSYSGAKAVQAAADVQKAIEAVGGVSNLTAKEQASANRILEEGLAKYQALGREAPAGMQALADETKQVNTHSSTLRDTVRGLATDFLAMFTARAAFSFVKDTIAEASALQDLSNKTHINVEELQLLASAMSEFGVDTEELGKGLFKLSQGIAVGDDSVVHGLALMGMSLKDVAGLNGQELFLKIEHGLSTLQGGLRDTAAAELFGEKLGGAMAGASDEIDTTVDKARALNTVMSTESVKAMDEFGESIERTNKSLSNMAANTIGPLSQGFNVLYDAGTKGATTWQIFKAVLADTGAALMPSIAHTEALATLIDHLNKETEKNTAATGANANAHGEAAKALDAHGQAAKFMAALEMNSVAPLLDWQVAYMKHLEAIGQLTAINAQGVGVNAAQFERYKKSVDDAKASVEVWAKFHLETMQIASAAEQKFTELMKAHLQTRNQSVIDGFRAIRTAQQQLQDFEDQSWMETTDFQIKKIWQVADEQIRAFEGTEEQRAKFASTILQLASAQADALYEKDAEFADKTKAKLEEVAAAAAAAFSPGATHPGGMLPSSASLTAAGFIASMGSTSGIAPRDNGGPVKANESYYIGTGAQPEKFTPTQDGWMTPAGAQSGPITLTTNLVVDGRLLASIVNTHNMATYRNTGGRIVSGA